MDVVDLLMAFRHLKKVCATLPRRIRDFMWHFAALRDAFREKSPLMQQSHFSATRYAKSQRRPSSELFQRPACDITNHH
ncbi:hypothetical protein K7R23_02255 [Citrobacter rodentium NBRC 105723 = DSM 16636]|uniref:hypothetical protein n=1 Tax=Citrobacter rodentium TaxID=67825 RepID=UPI0011D0717F|nr:hypothetical protein [Citrobacter rodentium]UHO31578.1 hypothetical protein K7R23_02255 [Citrobacter rodentium NBRC 105723 = DSM 16636]